jgi:GT2 family glycosyltransferase
VISARERTAHLSAAQHLRDRIKAATPHALVDAVRKARARLLSRGLPRNAVFAQPPEQSLASASMSIVIAIHDAPQVTLRCLASLERYAPNSQVILVDDASKLAQTTDAIRDFSSRNGWQVISNREPRGHSAACAAGAVLATRPYLCLLNSDTVITPWCWRPLAQAFESDASIGIAGPSTSFAGNDQTLDAARCCRFYWDDGQICAFAERLTVNPPQPAIVDLPWVSGFALFLPRRLWEEMGGFDPTLPDYGNEIELCKRVLERGLRTVWIRNAYIHHFAKQSFGETIGEDGIQARIQAADIRAKQED